MPTNCADNALIFNKPITTSTDLSSADEAALIVWDVVALTLTVTANGLAVDSFISFEVDVQAWYNKPVTMAFTVTLLTYVPPPPPPPPPP